MRSQANALVRRPRAPIQVCFPFIGDTVGGSHISALGLIRHLDPTRFRPRLVLHQMDGPLAHLLRSEGLAVEAAPKGEQLGLRAPRGARAVGQVLRMLPGMVDFLRQQDLAVVHTNDSRSHITWGVAGRLAGAKVLWHQRGDPNAPGVRFVAPWVAHRVVAVSRFAAPRPGPFSAAAKCTVIHSPFDVNLPPQDRAARHAALAAELGCSPETRFLGYMGMLVGRKRPLLLVDTIAALQRLAADIPVHGLLFGRALDGLDRAVSERAAALGIGERIHLMGFRYPGEPWIAGLDLLLVPAVDEPFGRTLIEAMLLGTPVVAAASGGNPEAIRDGETGVLVRPDDPEALAAAVLTLLREPGHAAALAEAARRDVSTRFSVAAHAEALMQVYEEMLAR